MERKETLTTKEHYNKYDEIKKGINKNSCLSLVEDLYNNVEGLQNKFNDDIHLNNIPMVKIDGLHWSVKRLLNKNMSLCDTCCFIKHILIYDILGIKPVFEDDILNYKDLWREWYTLPNKQKRIGSWADDYILKNRKRWVLK